MLLTDRSCTRRILLQIMHTGVQPLMSLVMFIPEDSLTYQYLPCNLIRTSFLDYISLYALMVLQQVPLLSLK